MLTEELQTETPKVTVNENSRPEKLRTVLFVTHTPGYGGTEKHLIDLLNRIDDRTIRSIILCAEGDPYMERLSAIRNSSVSIRSEPSLKSTWERPSLPYAKFSLKQLWKWIRVFRETKPEVVVFVYGALSQIPWFAFVAARLAGIRKIFAIQHLIPLPLPKDEGKSFADVLRRLVGRQARLIVSLRVPPFLATKTICVSNAVRNALIEKFHYPPATTVTIHNGVPVSEFVPSKEEGVAIRSKLGIRADEFVLVCAARLSHEKGIDILIQAISRLRSANISCKCIVVGEGELKEKLLEQIRTLDLTQHVFLEGFHRDIRPYLHAADAFILVSYYEGLPFAILEAMACGLPCIVTNVGGNAEAVAQDLNGLVVNAGSVDEAAAAISFLVTHPEERARMARIARTRACEEFDIEVKLGDFKQAILA
jgi:glycosyltransferase involved in cell wall biosynthesis